MSIIDHAEFLRRIKDGGHELPVFYDIGANIGRWTRAVSSIFPASQFELFEPLIGRHEEIDQHLLLDEFHADYSVHSIALSDFSGTEKIKLLGNCAVGSSILILDSDYRKDTTIIEVPVYRLDDYVVSHGLPYPSFLKLDTQASELKILSAAERCMNEASFCLVETWMRKVYGPETPLFQDLVAFFQARDYQLYEILIPEDGRDPDGTLRWFDAIFMNKRKYPHPESWY